MTHLVRTVVSALRSSGRPPSGLHAGPATGAVLVGLLVFALLYPFVDQDYRYNFQFDTQVFASHVGGFRAALATGDLRNLPRLDTWPPYLDAYNVLLTALTAATSAAGDIWPSVAQALPSVEVQTNFWGRWLSLGIHALGCAFLWLCLLRLSGRPLVAVALVLLVALAPTLIDMDFGRNDWGVIGSLSAALYFGVCISQGDPRRRMLVGMGLSVGLLATMKLNGPVFLVLTLAAAFSMLANGQLDRRRGLILTVTTVATIALISIRQIYYIADLIPNTLSQVEDLRRWAEGSPKPSTFYYSWELLQSHGLVFRYLLWMSVPIAVTSAIVRPRLDRLFVVGAFAVFLVGSLTVDYGFARGGYHLLPLFATIIAVAVAGIEESFPTGARSARVASVAAAATCMLLLAEPLLAAGTNYIVQARHMFARPSAVVVTRLLPAEWMLAAFPKGSRVAALGTNEMAFIPPIHGRGLAFDDSLLVRAGDVEPYQSYEPPSLAEFRQTADVFVVTDWQLNELTWRLTSLGRQDAAHRWTEWMAMLRREIPSMKFSAPTPGYYYSSVEIFALHPSATVTSLRAALASVDSPAQLRGPE